MPKVKISEYSATANSNTDVASINIDEGCAPSGINNAIRAIMGHLKDFQSGTSNDPFTVGSSGSLTLSYGTANGVAYLNGSKVLTTGSALVFDGTNLGVGVTPSNALSTTKALEIGQSGALYGKTSTNEAGLVNNYYQNSGGSVLYKNTGYANSYIMSSGHLWYTAPSGTAGAAVTLTQAMTLDASGTLLVGTTNTSQVAGVGFKLKYNATAPAYCVVGSDSTSANSGFIMYSTGAGAYRFYVDYAGTIFATSTSISAISDKTLKTNVRDLETGLTEVLALQPRRFDWINGDATNVAGFVAQEVEQVLPELVTDYRYNVDEEGNDIIKKSLKMGDILPTLVKAIQEQQALITTLTDRITALEAK